MGFPTQLPCHPIHRSECVLQVEQNCYNEFMKPKILLLIFLYYIGNFVVLPYLVILIGNSLQISGLHNKILQIIGMSIIFLGIVNLAYCYHVFFNKGEGTPFSTQPTQKLIVGGPFKYTRNPLYLSQYAIIFGEFLWLGNYTLLAYLVMFVMVYHVFVIPYEEARNEKRFGAIYRDYIKSVPRYL